MLYVLLCETTKVADTVVENAVIEAFKASRGIYCTRKINDRYTIIKLVYNDINLLDVHA